MCRNNKLLILEDDAQRTSTFRAIFDFLGEEGHFISTTGLDEHIAQEPEGGDYVLILISEHCTDWGESLVEKIHAWNDEVAIALIGEKPVTDGFDPLLKCKVIGAIDVAMTYNPLLDLIHRARLYCEAQSANKKHSQQRPVHLFRSLVGTSREVQNVREMMSQVADKEVSVLITGESGTGKEVVARNLHYHSDRREKPFVPVNCGAIPAELLESELFGHEKGAFTGAISARAGRFELAEGGTLFLDEIGDMPLNMQVKILRVLQERCYERVGSNKTVATNVRIIAATHRNLETMIDEGKFREDLYYRLNVFPIELPALKDRAEDIPLLVNELVSRMESENRGSVRFNSAAILSLCRHEWSGNIRELANLVERMAIMHPFAVAGVTDLPVKYRHVDVLEEDFGAGQVQPEAKSTTMVSMGDTPLLPDQGIDLRDYLTSLEKGLIQQALNDSGGVVARAAERLSIRRTTLVEKMRKYDLQR
ncbi:sigma-54 dependent transcriptional regulator [Gilvimarinus agarilyticus]|uniref:sigma-54 dependent transcriptional regulator n=1 Tax=unclassified Gilvimarinus TaxID=2642066 RepID=UPI001C096AAA|nr:MULTISPECIES: sigma-54 dependent transcriptional regulator [unclassified Gilvimarinus]MBU2887242.1 sigma-54 dependent transcriptional regulator [Gilvimarinus agarilyticus]MDO6571901.1 sigma-54 dependent transcriptional regulator [Gilvimarinus sp. 2_MG-2023]MDO6745970.1 sigma-54 dependent transcriptional regulator [Gilvimarinus sp. 1_MG-2023]